ncbi:Proline-rich receptor-like protein kinase PERK1 [Cytospora mali]|uniref:Proline-rich receptor-like protein kinase PERK1 n=1 Tax=Cytospora mali TaxID=578113 RepID=A0A194VBX8_CYTMA|nr:Proline-rich receptor-like protein kinase PERK1 [Valsa mali var. pyri (nom. inval.)]
MRICSSTVWLLSALLASIAKGSNITFEINYFIGYDLTQRAGEPKQTTILNTTQLSKGNGDKPGNWMVGWYADSSTPSATVNSVILAVQDDGSSYEIGSGYNAAISNTRDLLSERTLISNSGNPHVVQTFPMDSKGRSLTLDGTLFNSTWLRYKRKVLFFQISWTGSTGSTGYSYSPPWAVVDNQDEAFTISGKNPTLVTSTSSIYPDGSSPMVATSATSVTSATNPSSLSTSTTAKTSSSAKSSSSKGKSGGLSTGAIVGIAVGAAAGLILIGLIAGCFCFRRRRRQGKMADGVFGVPGDNGSRDVHTMQDLFAEKEARVGILDGDQPDTPYSEQGSSHHQHQHQHHRAGSGVAPAAQQHPLGRGLVRSGMNESGVDMGIGQAVSSGDGANDRSSVVYSSIGGGANSVTDIPVIAPAGGTNGSPTHTHQSSSVHERSFTPYTDQPAPGTVVGGLPPCKQQQLKQQQHEYSQHHHHVVDGADLVHQEHFNDRAGRSPTRGGMTEDEIRRLEEEERALDEAIEQAGRGR